MISGEVTADYIKPFDLFYYNRPKKPALKVRKGPIDYRAEPKIPVKSTIATRMRDKVIKDFMEADGVESSEDLHLDLMEMGKLITKEPKITPRYNKTSHYRYKWVREVPVVSCRFTEHVMMFKKPPFTLETQRIGHACGQYRLRHMEIKDPVPEEVPAVEEEDDYAPSILS